MHYTPLALVSSTPPSLQVETLYDELTWKRTLGSLFSCLCIGSTINHTRRMTASITSRTPIIRNRVDSCSIWKCEREKFENITIFRSHIGTTFTQYSNYIFFFKKRSFQMFSGEKTRLKVHGGFSGVNRSRFDCWNRHLYTRKRVTFMPCGILHHPQHLSDYWKGESLFAVFNLYASITLSLFSANVRGFDTFV